MDKIDKKGSIRSLSFCNCSLFFYSIGMVALSPSPISFGEQLGTEKQDSSPLGSVVGKREDGGANQEALRFREAQPSWEEKSWNRDRLSLGVGDQNVPPSQEPEKEPHRKNGGLHETATNQHPLGESFMYLENNSITLPKDESRIQNPPSENRRGYDNNAHQNTTSNPLGIGQTRGAPNGNQEGPPPSVRDQSLRSSRESEKEPHRKNRGLHETAMNEHSPGESVVPVRNHDLPVPGDENQTKNPSEAGEFVDRTFPNQNRVKRSLPFLVAGVAGAVGTANSSFTLRNHITELWNTTKKTDQRFSDVNNRIRIKNFWVESQKEIVEKKKRELSPLDSEISIARGILDELEDDLENERKFKRDYPNSSLMSGLRGDKNSALLSKITGQMKTLIETNKEDMRKGNARYNEAFEHLLRWEWRSNHMLHTAELWEGLARDTAEKWEQDTEGSIEGAGKGTESNVECIGKGQLECSQKKLRKMQSLLSDALNFKQRIQNIQKNMNRPAREWYLEKRELEDLKEMLATEGRRLWSKIIDPSYRKETEGRYSREDVDLLRTAMEGKDFDSFETAVERVEKQTWDREQQTWGRWREDHDPRPKEWFIFQPPWIKRDVLKRERLFPLVFPHGYDEESLDWWRSELIRIYQESSWVDIPKDIGNKLRNVIGKMYENHADVRREGLVTWSKQLWIGHLKATASRLRDEVAIAEPRLMQVDLHDSSTSPEKVNVKYPSHGIPSL